MKFPYALIVAGLFAALPAWAVYAPVPEQEQGKDLTYSLKAGLSYDSNIFGGATDAISSNVYEVTPRVSYNASLTDQTFLSAGYGLTVDDFERRPGSKVLYSHDLSLRGAHAFSKSTTLDVSDAFLLSRNPESLLNGVPLNVDQSFLSNQLDGHYTTALTPKLTGEVKARSMYYKYRDASLGRSLDNVQNLYGLAGDYAVLPEVKAVAEYRHLDVYYRKEGELKNKSSDYFMGGADYEIAKKLTLSSRLGVELRRRSAAPDSTGPFAELSGKYDYGENSFVTAGYAYSFDETSDPQRFTDEKINRAFINVQHAVTALIVASVSADYEPAVLQGRRDIPRFGVSQPNISEDTLRVGGALTYVRNKNWSVTASYDYDHVRSDDPSRSLERHRVGLFASYTF